MLMWSRSSLSASLPYSKPGCANATTSRRNAARVLCVWAPAWLRMKMSPQSSRCCWTITTSRHCTRLSYSRPLRASNHSNASRPHPIIPDVVGVDKIGQSHSSKTRLWSREGDNTSTEESARSIERNSLMIFASNTKTSVQFARDDKIASGTTAMTVSIRVARISDAEDKRELTSQLGYEVDLPTDAILLHQMPRSRSKARCAEICSQG